MSDPSMFSQRIAVSKIEDVVEYYIKGFALPPDTRLYGYDYYIDPVKKVFVFELRLLPTKTKDGANVNSILRETGLNDKEAHGNEAKVKEQVRSRRKGRRKK